MAASGLTLAALLFLLLVYLPGSLALLAAGKKQQDRTVPASVFYGTLILAVTLSVFWGLASTGRSGVLQRFSYTLATVTEGSGPIDLPAVAAVFVVCYATACIIGLSELFLVAGFYVPPRWARGLFGRTKQRRVMKFVRNLFAAARGMVADCPSGVRVRPTDTVLDIFVRFRRAGKRPYLKVVLKNGTLIKGECLRFSWDGKESVLLADPDDPSQLTWVSLDEVVSIKFLNLDFLDAMERTERYLEEIEKSRQILNGILPGYGDEVYNRRFAKQEEKLTGPG